MATENAVSAEELKVNAAKMQISTTDVAIDIVGMHKWYGEFHVLKDINLKVMRGERIVICGPSGSGKSTMIRCINRLEEHQKGKIIVDGKELTNDLKKIDEVRREVGMVFQHFNLFPHLTILENCTLAPIWVRKTPKKQAEEIAMHFLKRVKIPEQANKYPGQLSGGQQQRVAICRALVYEPKVLLLDEPLSNLDAKLREEARFWIRRLIIELGTCAIMVTHDQGEALAMADHVLLLKDGVIVQQGAPIDIYSEPQTFYSAEFLGTNNVTSGRVRAHGGDRVTVEGDGWGLQGVWRGKSPPAADAKGRVVIRVERVAIAQGPGPHRIEMEHDQSLFVGDKWEHRMRRGDLRIRAYGARKLAGGSVWCEIEPESVWVFEDAA